MLHEDFEPSKRSGTFLKRLAKAFTNGVDRVYPVARVIGGVVPFMVVFHFIPWYWGFVIWGPDLFALATRTISNQIYSDLPELFVGHLPQLLFKDGLPHLKFKEEHYTNRISLAADVARHTLKLIFEPFAIIINYTLNILAFPLHAYKSYQVHKEFSEPFMPATEPTTTMAKPVVRKGKIARAPTLLKVDKHDQEAGFRDHLDGNLVAARLNQ